MENKGSCIFEKIKSGELSELPFARRDGNAILLSVYIQPNAGETAIVGLHDNRLKIKIATLPVDGKANVFLCEFVAKQLSILKKNVSVLHGKTSRKKLLKINI